MSPHSKLNSNINSSDAVTQSPRHSSSLNYVLLLGKGRSGTTWLAQLMNTYEHCCYKNEPFPARKQTPYNAWLKDLESGDTEELLRRFESICRHCYLCVDDKPHPEKSFLSHNWLLLLGLRGLARQIESLRFLYERYEYLQLNAQNQVVIKDVTFTLPPRCHQLQPLCELLQPYIIVIVRNPFANIASVFKGREKGVFGTKNDRDKVIAHLLGVMDTPLGKHLSNYSEQLQDMSIAQLEAVRWRTEVEPLVEYARSYGKSRVVVYEELCTDPHGKIAEIFDFLGWELGQATRDFIDTSTSGNLNFKNSSRASYYSVYRDPHQSMSKWKTQLTSEQIADIASVVRDSPLINLWSDLPLYMGEKE